MRPFLLLLVLGACSPASGGAVRPVASPDLRPLAAELREVVRRHAADTAEIAVALRDLATGDSLLLWAHVPMHAASTMKVPVMLELFRRAGSGDLSLDDRVEVRNEFRSVADGSAYALSPDDDSDPELHSRIGERLPVRELVRRMIVRSSNLATNLLVELARPDRIAATLAEIGAGEMKVLRGVEDGPAFRRGMSNTTTAYGFMKALEAIAMGTGVSAAAREEMLSILEGQEFREMIPAGVPAGVRVGNKTGWITGIQHDGAIVLPPGRAPYVLVVLTRGMEDRDAAAAAVREVSAVVWRTLALGDGRAMGSGGDPGPTAAGAPLLPGEDRLDALGFADAGAAAVHRAPLLHLPRPVPNPDEDLGRPGERRIPGRDALVGGEADREG